MISSTSAGSIFRLALCLMVLLSVASCKAPDTPIEDEEEKSPELPEAVPTMSYAEAKKIYGEDAIYVLLSIEGNSSLDDYVVTGLSEYDGMIVVICKDKKQHDCIP